MIEIGGSRLTPADLAEAVREYEDSAGVITATGSDASRVLIATLAGFETGRSVIVGDPSAAPIDPGLVPDHDHLVTVTSGSAGLPRPILRTLDSWRRSFDAFTTWTGIEPDDRVGITGPLHASMHLFAAVHACSVGADVTDRIGEATVLHCVPTVLERVLDDLEPTAPLQTVITVGSSLPGRVVSRAVERGIEVIEYYGAAELSLVAAGEAPEPLNPFRGVDLEVREGVLWARSEYLAEGYLGAVDGPFERDARGFGTVGDLAEINSATGRIRVLGRADAAITVGGATILAEDVEMALQGVPGVRAAAAIGIPHSQLGQVIAAVLELEPEVDLDQVRLAARGLLRGEAMPRRWQVVDSLPRTGSGKIARGLLASEVVDQ